MANFNISAAVVYQLGEELVSDEITALMELVKNSYDADASYANVIINTAARVVDDAELGKPCPNGYITIEDDGRGMGLMDIEQGWLVISLSHKRKMKMLGETTRGGRTPMGDKGLGRLSTQRLGNVLEMVTTRAEDKVKNVVSFNWGDFYSEKLLTDVLVDIWDIPKSAGEHGTKLLITDLRDTQIWDKERITIQNKLSQLISPFSEARSFQVFLTINGEPIELDKIAKRIREAASSTYSFNYKSGAGLNDKGQLTIKGSVKLNKIDSTGSDRDIYQQLIVPDQGREFFAYLTNPASEYYLSNITYRGENGWFIDYEQVIDLEGLAGLHYQRPTEQPESGERVKQAKSSQDEKQPSERNDGSEQEKLFVPVLADPGSFAGEIDDFKLRPDESLDNIFNKASEYKEFVKRQVGIRIFRDGFGIRPYGYEGQDWLGLGRNQTSGSSFYGLRPNNVIGFVNLRGEINKKLKEKTDREGFVENDYSRNFFLLTSVVRDRINTFIETVRRGYVEFRTKQIGDAIGLDVTSYQQSVRLLNSTSQEATKVEQQIGQLSDAVDQANVTLSQTNEALQAEGSTAAAVALTPLLERLRQNLIDADQQIQSTKKVLPRIKQITSVARIIEPRFNELSRQLREFSELASLGLVAESFSHELVNISNRLDLQTQQAEDAASKLSVKEFTAYINAVRSSVGSLRKQLSHLAPSLKYVREKQESVAVKRFMSEQITFYRHNYPTVRFTEVEPFQEFTIRANKGKLSQIIDNVVLNAIYWVKSRAEKVPDFQPEVYFASSQQALTIWDNGLGVEPDVEHSLFKSFTTTKTDGSGRGLGLFIVEQLLDTMNSTIALLPERNEHQRRYKFIIDLKNAIQV
ncbi:sensor histidine kinase [Spirosoma sordidisoli]|uniref:histidine kinase n=1 Tax=Spirosoma sordidisoli TaxID=2502893 RepID=A0A4Q2UHK4_9BACT|nr:sensor histidine kinase [Spirosoma sordidisoli]RYC66955.1 sensor histidine kinase [Spirosoma sordidisoli]